MSRGQHSLAAYQPPREQWTLGDAAHLLRRTQFGASHQEIVQAHELGMQAAVQKQLQPREETPRFVETEAILRRAALASGAIGDLKAWWVYRMIGSANPLTEKMTLCWHNHFATSNAKVRSVPAMLRQNDLLRQYAVSDFRTLLHAMARDGAMLIWLDGNANRKRQANENFARELMELFSLGVGNYTEADIKEAARAFTGWHVRDEQYWFHAIQHDTGTKTVFGKSGNWDGDNIVDLCLEQDACPRFLASKLLALFLTDRPAESIITPLAERIRANAFDMGKVLDELLRSELFYSSEYRHAIIKSPVDFLIGSQRTLEVQPNLGATARELAALGQDLFEPPTVKGWEGGRNWISSATLLRRANLVQDLVYGTSLAAKYDPAAIVNRHVKGNSPEQVVDFFSGLFCDTTLSEQARASLISYYRTADGNQTQRLEGLTQLLMTAPEYQLM